MTHGHNNTWAHRYVSLKKDQNIEKVKKNRFELDPTKQGAIKYFAFILSLSLIKGFLHNLVFQGEKAAYMLL